MLSQPGACASQVGSVEVWGALYNLPLIQSGTRFTAIATIEHNLALKSDGSISAWGRNDELQTIVPDSVGGIAVEVMTRRDTPGARRKIEASLEEHGVPVRELLLVEDRSQLQHPVPLRGDLREHVFSPSRMDSKPAIEASMLERGLIETGKGRV